ncbi:MAG: AAA family ATPase [Gemmataceae bacterium]
MIMITFAPASRDNLYFVIAMSGPSGGGKTLSALKVARGMVGGDDSKIFVLDTESGRAKYYAPPSGQKPGPQTFGFMHADIRPPFRPQTFVDAVRAAENGGAKVIVIDSMSHEWSGEGGVLDWAEEELTRMAGSDYAKREKVKMASWIKPKMAHKAMMQALLQVRAHIIFCLRSEEKMKMAKVPDGRGGEKTIIVQASDRPLLERWEPVCAKDFMFEATTSMLLLPSAPGVPMPVKIQEQHRPAFPDGKPITEETGRVLAEWAAGGMVGCSSPPRLLSSKADLAMAWADKFISEQQARIDAGDTAGFAAANAKHQASVDKLIEINPDAYNKVVTFLNGEPS